MSFDNLISAVRRGDIAEISAELSGCPEENPAKLKLLGQFTKKSGSCMTPLMLASSKGHVEVIKLLKEKGAEVNTMSLAESSGKSVSALMAAARSNKVEAVRTLIGLKADVNLRNENGDSALLFACKNGNTELVKVLLSGGATCNLGDGSASPLRAVIDSDKVDLAKILLMRKHGVKVLSDDLKLACKKGNFAMVKALLQSCSKSEMNVPPNGGWSPLMIASAAGRNDIVELLLSHGADIDAETGDGKYALLLAIKKGHVSTVELLRENSAKVKNSIIMEVVNSIGRTPRDCAQLGRLPENKVYSIVKLLIDHDRDVDTQSEYLSAPLLCAIRLNACKIVELLIDSGADVNLAAGDKESGPLKMAVETSHLRTGDGVEMVQVLLDKNADVNLKNLNGVTPLMVASTRAIASLLVNHGAKLDEVDDKEKSALMHMVENERFQASDVLLGKGASYTLSDDEGRHPASIIKQNYDRLGLKDEKEIPVIEMNKKLLENQRPFLEMIEKKKLELEERNKSDPYWRDRQLTASRYGEHRANVWYPPPAAPTPQAAQPVKRQTPQLGDDCKENTNGPSASKKPKQNITPSMASLCLLKWQNGEKEFRLMNQVSAKWKKFGTFLKITQNDLDGFDKKCRGDPEACWTHVMQCWLDGTTSTYDATWEGLYKLLNDLQLPKVATDLKEAVDSY